VTVEPPTSQHGRGNCVGVPLDLLLQSPDGRTIRLGELLTRRLTVVQVRYLGCLPCQEWLIDLGAAPRLGELGAGAGAVGGSAVYQASWLREEKCVAMPLLLDPDHHVREASATRNRSSFEC
jgi:hypothetical protein